MYDIHQTLTVKAGKTLTISAGSTVQFGPGAKLIVEPNATLTLHGKLTSRCGETWQGVEVWGNALQTQYPVAGIRAQGRFIGRPGSVVENAQTGVRLWGPDPYLHTGGQIQCLGTTFRNNVMGINFAPYRGVQPGASGQPANYQAVFSGCDFITNEDWPVRSSGIIRLNRIAVKPPGGSERLPRDCIFTDCNWGKAV